MQRNELFKIGILIFLTILLTSCAGKQVTSNEILLKHAAAEKTDKLNSVLMEKRADPKKLFTASDYKVGPEDVIEVSVFGVDDLHTIARVSATGNIRLPLIDNIQAAGLTITELEAAIAKKLKKYVTEPAVSVYIKEYRSQQIAVLGAVKSPGVYYVTGYKSLIDLISLAGGLSQDAGDVAIIQNAFESNSGAEQPAGQTVIDLTELLISGRTELNIPLSAGAIVNVPQSGIFFVDGSVKSPGSFPLKGKITLTQAISMAKGFSYEASLSDITIYRDEGKPERGVITADYDALIKRESPDIEIKDKDIVIVSRSGFKSFIKGFSGALNFGFFSIGKGF